MKTFIQWAEKAQKELPLFEPIGENTKRAGIARWAYPDAYTRSQYPDAYFMPIAADAMQKMGVKKASNNDTK